MMSIIKKYNKHNLGAKAEYAAKNYLKRQGLQLITQNYHCRFGEIDLIMQDEQTLVFIEVRCRADNAQVSAAESITPAKQRKICKTAEYYLMRYATLPDCRFDVIAMTHSPDKIGYTIHWIQSAF